MLLSSAQATIRCRRFLIREYFLLFRELVVSEWVEYTWMIDSDLFLSPSGSYCPICTSGSRLGEKAQIRGY